MRTMLAATRNNEFGLQLGPWPNACAQLEFAKATGRAGGPASACTELWHTCPLTCQSVLLVPFALAPLPR